jgi:hypothetical protein
MKVPTPEIAHALEWLRRGDVAADPAMVQKDDAFDRRARLFASVFGDAGGGAVLYTILEGTIFRAPVDHRLTGEAYLRYAQLREGQNQVAAMILAYLEHFNTLENDNGGRHGPASGRQQHGGPDAGSAPGDAGDTPGGWSDIDAPGIAVR